MSEEVTTVDDVKDDTAAEDLWKVLQGELSEVMTKSSTYTERCLKNDYVRECVWDNQNEEGVKEGEDVFPFEGASDTRVRMADSIINERVMLRQRAFKMAKVQAVATEVTDLAQSQKVSTLMRWMLLGPMRRTVMRQHNLSGNIQDNCGCAVMGIFWHQETRVNYEARTLEDLKALAQEMEEKMGDPLLSNMLGILFDRRPLCTNQQSLSYTRFRRSRRRRRGRGKPDLRRRDRKRERLIKLFF